MKKVRQNPKDGWYEITPSDAQRLLESRVGNRVLRESVAALIAADI